MKHERDLTLVALTDRRKRYRFQSIVFRDLKTVVLVMVPLHRLVND